MNNIVINCNKYIRLFFWNVLILISLLAVLEIGTRVAIKVTRGSSTASMHERTMYLQYEPYVMFGPDWEAKFKKYGQKKALQKRILLLGGSVAMGFPDSLITKYLEVEGDSFEVELINAAYGGYCARQELVLAALWSQQLSPDLIISLDGANDIIHRLRMEEPSSFYLNNAYRQLLMKPNTGFVVALLRKSQFFWSIVRLNSRNNLQPAEAYLDLIPVYLAALKGINNIAKGMGVNHLSVIQPHVIFKSPLSREEEAFHVFDYRKPVVKRLYEQTEHDLTQFSETHKMAFLNAIRLFEHTPQRIFSDDVHFADNVGYDMLGKNIAAYINQHQLLESKNNAN